jgi:SOS-response transcriptional repressor LexA
MKNTAQNKSENIEWLSLDDYVKSQNYKTLYVRVHGNACEGISSTDLIVVYCGKKAKSNDIVLIKAGEVYTIKKYADVKGFISPLRLAARNGQSLDSEGETESMNFVGVVAYVLKSLEVIQ